jgi:hypothetical protein
MDPEKDEEREESLHVAIANCAKQHFVSTPGQIFESHSLQVYYLPELLQWVARSS